MSERPEKPRLTITHARQKAAKACGVDVRELSEGIEHVWGWSFVIVDAGGGSGPIFVDATRGLVATSELDEEARIAVLEARGPLGVPPWSPPPKQTWWQAVLRALGRFGI